jgi:hypothetical protein
MPESLTRKKRRQPPQGWPASNRNGGRIYFGTVAGFKSESLAGMRRNLQSAAPGAGLRVSGDMKN